MLENLVERLRCRRGDRETSAIFFLGLNDRILSAQLIEGCTSSLELPLRQILQCSADLCARQLLLFHTHPSGDPRPSIYDVAATRALCRRLRQQGQRLMDHVILTRNRYFSFRANGML